MTRQSDTNHDQECYNMHHDHDKRIAVLEIEVKMNRETINNSITELVDRQATHEEKFERMLERMTAALVGIELKMEKYMVAAQSSSSTWEKVWKYGTPILIAAIGAAWMLHKNG